MAFPYSPSNVELFWSRKKKPKCQDRVAKLGYGHLCLREENLSFDNNYMILLLSREGT